MIDQKIQERALELLKIECQTGPAAIRDIAVLGTLYQEFSGIQQKHIRFCYRKTFAQFLEELL